MEERGPTVEDMKKALEKLDRVVSTLAQAAKKRKEPQEGDKEEGKPSASDTH